MLQGAARVVVGMAIVGCVFAMAGCSEDRDRGASLPPAVAGPGTVVGSWLLRLGDPDKPEEFELELGIDGTAVATDRCNFIKSDWVSTADPAKITFAETTITQRLCVDRPDFIGVLASARLDDRDRLLVTASGREWTYERRRP